MSTIDSKSIIFKLLGNNGHYQDDLQVYSIWSYRSQEGQKTQAIFYHPAHEDMEENPYLAEPELLWNQKIGITRAGQLWLQENKFEKDSK